MKKENETHYFNDIGIILLRILKGSLLCGIAIVVTQNVLIGLMGFIIGADGILAILKRNI